MSEAPYDYDQPPPGPDYEGVKSRVLGPAIFLLIVHILNLLIALGALGNGLYVLLEGPDELHRKAVASASALPPTLRDAVLNQDPQTTYNTAVAEYVGGGGVWLVLALLGLFGAFRMISLRNYGLAVTSAVLAVIPCVTPCCLLGQIAGIWGLVVLMSTDVRSAFR